MHDAGQTSLVAARTGAGAISEATCRLNYFLDAFLSLLRKRAYIATIYQYRRFAISSISKRRIDAGDSRAAPQLGLLAPPMLPPFISKTRWRTPFAASRPRRYFMPPGACRKRMKPGVRPRPFSQPEQARPAASTGSSMVCRGCSRASR